MCGIIGFKGIGGDAVGHTVDGLKSLEYRGYDSAGIAFLQGNKFNTIKSVGNVEKLKAKVHKLGIDLKSTKIAIGHTRWATHGGVSEANCHPHISCDGKVAVVHNGIIENWHELVETLAQDGIVMKSQTDTEVIPNLVAQELTHTDLFVSAVANATKKLDGSFAILVTSSKYPNTVIAARRGRQPLILGKTKSGNVFISSDSPTAQAKCETIYSLESGEFAVLDDSGLAFLDENLSEINKAPLEISHTLVPVCKGKFKTFMEKEIFDIPNVIRQIQKHYRGFKFPLLSNNATIHIAACGTAYHAGLMLALGLESKRKIRTRVYIASEFPFIDPLIKKGDIGIVISQSGETADTLSAMNFMRESGIPIIAICNVEGSTVSRYADHCMLTHAGTEVSVASTKAFIAQVLVGLLLSSADSIGELSNTATRVEDVLSKSSQIKTWARQYHNFDRIFFLGKGQGAVISLESALKVKEITYKHCEGFPSGELKHGTLSLVDDKTLTIVFGSSCSKMQSKLQNAIAEVKARGSHILEIPPTCDVAQMVYAQLFALYLAEQLGLNPDQPRNLAKSVTVE